MKLTRKQIVLLAIFAGLDVLVICGLILAVTSSTLKANPPATPTFYVTPIPTRPTVPSTWTPTPIPVISQRVTPTSIPDVSANAYMLEVSTILDDTGASLDNLGSLLVLAGEAPSMLYNEDWVSAVVVEMVKIKLAAKDIHALRAPARLSECHSDLLSTATYLDSAMTLIAESIDEIDPDKLHRGWAAIDSATAALGDYSACVNRKYP